MRKIVQMPATMTITDAQRRARLGVRHHFGRTADDVTVAVRGVVAFHSSDPATPYLAAWARVPGFKQDALGHALNEARTLWRLHAMRRTLFIVPSDEAPVFDAATGRAVARKEHAKLERWLHATMAPASVDGWLQGLEAEILELLEDGKEWRTQDLGAAVAGLDTKVTVTAGSRTATMPLASRLLLVMAMEGRVVRTRAAGTWRSSQYRWASTSAWFGQPLAELNETEGRAALAQRYLARYGPVTLADLRWWTGWTARQSLDALHVVGAVPVRLEAGSEGFVLPDDVETVEAEHSAVALLPGLDSTPMGWKERDWYLGPHGPELFDRNGNVGPTIWVGGRIVGGWAQRGTGEVTYRLLEDGGREVSDQVAAEAAALEGWLAGEVLIPRFRSPLEILLSST